jgi:hypothetical protein
MPESVRRHERRTTRTHRHRWFGATAIGSAGLVALLALIMPVSAVVAPMTVVHTIKITAPFTGATSNASSRVIKSGCGTVSVVTPAFFHGRTGAIGFSGWASSHTCPSGAGGEALVLELVAATIPLVVLSGTNHFSVSWSIHVEGGSSLHLGVCTMPSGHNTSFSECHADTGSGLLVSSFVADATNGSIFYPILYGTWIGGVSGRGFDSQCFYGNCTTYASGGRASFSFHGGDTWHFTVPGLVKSHSYLYGFSFSGSQAVDQGSDFATLGYTDGGAWLSFGATLNSIVIT